MIEIHLFLHNPVLSILDDVFIVSPKRQYRGFFNPTTAATIDPVNK